MTVGNLPEPALITRPAALRQLASLLSNEAIVAVDTESNSLYVYHEQVCLIQFSTLHADYLVDPLSVSDLSPLGLVFSNPAVEKVFHAAEYDLICLKRDFGFEVVNLFDTMVAARILGKEAVGLGSLLESEFNIHLDKRYQRANWGQRPLPSHLVSYAREDTHYLIPLGDRLQAALQARNLWPLAVEDFHRVSKNNSGVVEDRVVDCWRVRGSFDLDPQEAAVLLELCCYRDKVAQSINRPLFKVISDHTLVEIARLTPKSHAELSRAPGMTQGQVSRHGQAILEAVRRGLQSEPVYPPRSQRPNEKYLDRVEALRKWRKTTAATMGVDSDVVLPRDLIFALAERNPRFDEDLAQVMSNVPWRLEHFGRQILQTLQKS